MPTQLPFGEWLPDSQELDSAGLTECQNLIPGEGFYRPFPSVSVYSSAMGEPARGAWSGYVDNRFSSFVGTQTKIYLVNTSTPLEVASGLTTPPNTYWQFERFGEDLIAANGSDPIKKYDLDESSDSFSDFITSASAPTSRFIAVAKSFLVLGNTIDSSNVKNTQRIWWSGINDPDNFPTPGGVEANTVQSSYNDLNDPDGGEIRALFGGDELIIFLEKSIWQASYIGGNFVWQFFKVADKRGLYVENCAKRIDRTVYFLDETGFFSYTPGSLPKNIGYGKVDRYFWENVHQSYVYDTHAAIDEENKLILWVYVDANSGSTTPDRALAYNYVTGWWSRLHHSTPFMFFTGSTGYTLDELDAFGNLDFGVTVSLDSRFWQGGVGVLAGVDSSNRVVHYNSTAQASKIETQEIEASPGRRSIISGVRPVINGSATVFVQIGSRSLQTSSVSYSSTFSVNSNTGWHNMRVEGRYHRVRVATSGAFTKLIGIDAEVITGGVR